MNNCSEDAILSSSEEFVAPDVADPRALADALGLSFAQLEDLIDLPATALEDQPDSADVQAAMGPLSHLVAKLRWMGGSDTEIAVWFNTTIIASLGRHTPIDHVAASNIAFLEAHLEDVLNGVYA